MMRMRRIYETFLLGVFLRAWTVSKNHKLRKELER